MFKYVATAIILIIATVIFFNLAHNAHDLATELRANQATILENVR